MTTQIFHEDICEFFESTKCPSIFSRRTQGQITLSTLDPGNKNQKQSIKAMQQIVDAIVCLNFNQIFPCQIKLSYVIKRNGKWGLRHVVCERNKQPDEDQIQDAYDPKEYDYHQHSENQLMWNLGKIWLRFFSKQTISIRYMKQAKIDQIISDNVENIQIRQILKKLLCWLPKQRMNFEQLLNCKFMIRQDNGDTMIYSSLMAHMKKMSSINTSQRRMARYELKSPFLRQIKYRRYIEYLDVDYLLQHVKSQINKQFNTEGQEKLCQFTSFIITLQSYHFMLALHNQKLNFTDRYNKIEDRNYYANFSKRLLFFKDFLERKRHMIMKKVGSDSRYLKYLKNDPDNYNPSEVNVRFKTLLVQWIEILEDDLKNNTKDIQTIRLLAKIYLARTSKYVFAQYRKQIFEPFLKEGKFNLKKIIHHMNECTKIQSFEKLIKNIKDFYWRQ